MNKVLVLGAGMVSRPLVSWLLDRGHILTVADVDKEKIISIIGNHPNALAVSLDANNDEELDMLVAQHDVVVSLLPFAIHPKVAKHCIRYKKSLVTSSYQSQAMLDMKPLIEESGIIVLNEMGLDPGIDHMSGKRIIDRVHARQGRVLSFYSICGALTAPEALDNPLAYKFTWSPKGVMAASLNNAQYLDKGEVISVNSEQLFSNPFKIELPEIGLLNVYPNRDSLSYREDYNLEEVNTLLRGTIRFPGWCETIDAMKKLGLLDTRTENMEHLSYINLIERKTGSSDLPVERQLAGFLNVEEQSAAIKSLNWLGFFSNELIGHADDSPFNITCDLMFNKMMLKDKERDMIIIQHELLVHYPDDHEERILSRLVEYGNPETDTAIARTVALPAAIAADMILNGEIKATGLLRPFSAEIYEPVLRKLEEEGIILSEEVKLLV